MSESRVPMPEEDSGAPDLVSKLPQLIEERSGGRFFSKGTSKVTAVLFVCLLVLAGVLLWHRYFEDTEDPAGQLEIPIEVPHSSK